MLKQTLMGIYSDGVEKIQIGINGCSSIGIYRE